MLYVVAEYWCSCGRTDNCCMQMLNIKLTKHATSTEIQAHTKELNALLAFNTQNDTEGLPIQFQST